MSTSQERNDQGEDRFSRFRTRELYWSVLFFFIMQAALETMKWPVPKREFFTRENGVAMGECTERKRGTTKNERSCLLYADDAALLFDSRGAI
jgi:hypothetical protein